MNSTFTNRILRIMEHHMPLPEPQYTPEQQREREWHVAEMGTKQRELEALRIEETGNARPRLCVALGSLAYYAQHAEHRMATRQYERTPHLIAQSIQAALEAIDKHERLLIEIELLAGDIADMQRQYEDPWHWSDEAKPWPRAGRKA